MQIGTADAFAEPGKTIHDNTITDIGFNDPTIVDPNTAAPRYPRLSRRFRPGDRQ